MLPWDFRILSERGPKNAIQIKIFVSQKLFFRYPLPYNIVKFDNWPSSGAKVPDKFIFNSNLQRGSPERNY